MRDRFFRNYFIVLATVGAAFILYHARPLFAPVLTALLVAYVLYPVVAWAQRMGIGKGVSIFVLFFGILGGLLYGVFSFLPAVQQEILAVSSGETEGKSKLVSIGVRLDDQLVEHGLIDASGEEEAARRQRIEKLISEWTAEQRTRIAATVGAMIQETGQFLLVFCFVLVFALLDGSKMFSALIGFCPNHFFEPGVLILNRTKDLLGNYLRGLVIENLLMIVAAFVLLLLFGLFSPIGFVLALSIALIIGLTNVIRIIGPVIGGAIGVGLVLLTSTNLIAMIGVVATVAIVQALDSVLFIPLVMKEQVDLHPVSSLLGVLTGGFVGGMLGMIVAIPVLGGIKVVYGVLTVDLRRFDMEPEG